MGHASKLVASGHCARGLSVRTYLTSGGAFASAGILALGLVAVPPDFNVRTEVRAVQLAAVTLPPVTPWGALLERLISNQPQTVVPVARVVGGATDITTPVVTTRTGTVTTPLTVQSVTDPATDRQQVNSAALSATTTPFDLPGILGPLYPYVGAALFIGGFAFVFLVVLPVLWFVETVASVLGLPPVLSLTATAEANPPTAPTLTGDPLLANSAPANTVTRGPSDEAPATKTGTADVSPPVTSIDKGTGSEPGTSTELATGNEQTSTETAKDVTETVGAEQASTEQPAASDAESAVDASEPTKPAGHRETPRPVVRDSLGTDEKVSEASPHRGNGGRATTEEPAGDRAATAGSSSADSSSTDSGSSDGGSSDGDSGGS